MLNETEKYKIVNEIKTNTNTTVSKNQKKLLPIVLNNHDIIVDNIYTSDKLRVLYMDDNTIGDDIALLDGDGYLSITDNINDYAYLYDGNIMPMSGYNFTLSERINRMYPVSKYHYIDKWYSYRYSVDNPQNNFSIIKINNLPFKSFYNRRDKDYFMDRIDRLIYLNELEPFFVFIDGKFVNWNDIVLVYDAGDIYLLIYDDKFNHFSIKHSKEICLVILPFKINYISCESDKVFNMYYDAYCLYMNESAHIINGKIYVNPPTINDTYMYNGIYLDVGWWLITQLKLNYLGLLSNDRISKLKNIGVYKDRRDENNVILEVYDTVFNAFDKDSYDNNIFDKFKNESLERCIDNSIFRFNDDGLYDANGNVIISEFIDAVNIYKYSSDDEYVKNICTESDSILCKKNYIAFENGLFKFKPKLSTWVGNSSIIYNPDRYNYDVVIFDNIKSDKPCYNYNVFNRNYVASIVDKYFNIMIDKKYFHIDEDGNIVYDLLELLTIDNYIFDKDSYMTEYDNIDNVDIENEMILAICTDQDIDIKELIYLYLLDNFKYGLDFSYDMKKLFSENVNESFDKIMEYNPLLLNKLFKTDISSTVITGEEANKWLVVQLQYEESKGLKIPRMKYEDHESFAMVFLNGELIDTYSELVLYPNFMFIPLDNDFKSDDEIELLYFNRCNNNEFTFKLSDADIIETLYDDDLEDLRYDVENKRIVQVDPTSMEYDDPRLKMLKAISKFRFIKVFQKYFNKDTASIFAKYPKSILTYADYIDESDDIAFNVSCRDKAMDELFIYNELEDYTDDLVIVDSNKFVYQRLRIDQKAYKIRLNKRFRYCDNQKQYMLFINGRRMDDEMFLVTIPKFSRPFDAMYIYLTKFVNPDDRIELFYLPAELMDINGVIKSELKENGYIECDKSLLSVPFDNDLYLLFINGKKIARNNIINVDASTFRISKDQKSRLNLIVTPCATNEITEMQDYLVNRNSEYDRLMSFIKKFMGHDELDKLFNSYVKMSDTEDDKYIVNVGKIAIINEIVRDFWVNNSYDYNNSPFVYDYETDEFMYRDEYDNVILPSMDATQEINIIKDSLHLLYFYFNGEPSRYVEKGRVLPTPKFEWEYNTYSYGLKTDIISQSINDVYLDPLDRSYTYPYNVSDDITFIFKAFDGFSIISNTIDIKFVCPIYYGLVDEDGLQHFNDADYVPMSDPEHPKDIKEYITTDDLYDLIPKLNYKLQEDCKLTLTDYVIGNNNYFVFIAPKNYVYDNKGKYKVSFNMPDINLKSKYENDNDHDDNTQKLPMPIYTNGEYNEDNTMVRLDEMKMVYITEFDYTNAYGYTEKYVMFRTNGFFTTDYESEPFNINIYNPR